MAQVQVVVFSDEENTMALTYVEDSRNLSHYEKMIRAKYNEESLSTIHLRGEDFYKQTFENYINDNDIDILSMINYKKGFLESILHKSMTKSMSYHTKIPLLSYTCKALIVAANFGLEIKKVSLRDVLIGKVTVTVFIDSKQKLLLSFL